MKELPRETINAIENLVRVLDQDVDHLDTFHKNVDFAAKNKMNVFVFVGAIHMHFVLTNLWGLHHFTEGVDTPVQYSLQYNAVYLELFLLLGVANTRLTV